MNEGRPGLPLLLEVGTEEIPARFFSTFPEHARSVAESVLNENRIEFTGLRCIATPRRFALFATITNPMQRTAITETLGPPARIAFGPDGSPTKAAAGFARSQSVNVEDLQVKGTDRGEYVVAVRETKGQRVSKILPLVLPALITSLHFPKSMRWGHHTMRFARPIRWVLCLLGSSVVRFQLDGIRSSAVTYGHRLLTPGRIPIGKPGEYERVLRTRFVIVDQSERKKLIENQLASIERETGEQVLKDESLLNHVNFLVEHPHAVRCEFPEKYLGLPPELLVTVMRDHQKYFSMRKSNGDMSSSFVVISNTARKNERVVREGAEKVIRARFEDARFYYTEDVTISLAARIESLKGITFHEKLGSLHAKVQRVTAVASGLCSLAAPAVREHAVRAAELSKSDLTTGVVREFPELQGIIGHYYALAEGLPREVALAIREHYKPLNASDTIPSTDAGRILSISDKVDNVVSFFSVGLIPSGSEDPYALRRQAQGIVQILLAVPLPLSLRQLLETAALTLGSPQTDFMEAVQAFFRQRVEFALLSADITEDVVRSIETEMLDAHLSLLAEKARAIRRFKHDNTFDRFLVAIKRVKNILPPSPPEEIDASSLSSDAERDLLGTAQRVSSSVKGLLESHDFSSALDELKAISHDIHAFFDSVLVMDKDEKVRNARLALLNMVWGIARSICDFSQIAESPRLQ